MSFGREIETFGVGYNADMSQPRPPLELRTPSEAERQQWEAEFEAAARRSLEQRMKYAFIKTYKPVLDDANFRAFDSLEEYRAWCEANLPSWLGYHRV